MMGVTFALAIVAWYVLNRTGYGRHIYATGDDPEAARLAGIKAHPAQRLCPGRPHCGDGRLGDHRPRRRDQPHRGRERQSRFHHRRGDRRHQQMPVPGAGSIFKENRMRITAGLIFAGAVSLLASSAAWSQTPPAKGTAAAAAAPKAAPAPAAAPAPTRAPCNNPNALGIGDQPRRQPEGAEPLGHRDPDFTIECRRRLVQRTVECSRSASPPGEAAASNSIQAAALKQRAHPGKPRGEWLPSRRCSGPDRADHAA